MDESHCFLKRNYLFFLTNNFFLKYIIKIITEGYELYFYYKKIITFGYYFFLFKKKMAFVHLWTEATESFVASSNNLAEATKLSGPIIIIHLNIYIF